MRELISFNSETLFAPAFIAEFAAVKLLESCGYEVIIPSREVCCDLLQLVLANSPRQKELLLTS